MGEVSAFEAACRRAVQSRLIFPAAAQMEHQHGIVRVSFLYHDGSISGVRVIRSSGFPMLDAAAVRTVKIAHFPAPPKDFAGQTIQLDIDVVFRMRSSSFSAD